MPEQAMSTMKFSLVPSGLVIRIKGLPYSLVKVEGMPIKLTSALETWALKADRAAPRV